MEKFKLFLNEQVEKTSLSVMFLGDIMNHEIQMSEAWNGTNYDYTNFFKHIKRELKSVDFCIGNLETVFGGKPYSGTSPFSSPDELAYALANSGINCLVTANNHSADCSADGVERTIDILDRYGIKHTGTFKDSEVATPLILEKNGVKLAILNYTWGMEKIYPKPHIVNLIGDPPDISGDPIHPNNINYNKISGDIKQAKSVADKVVVFFHWGDQYKFRPNKNQVSLKDFCFFKGADIVIGAHPHVVQPSCWYKNNDKYVAYSLGNFVAYQPQPHTSKGMTVKIDISKDKIENVKESMIASRLYPISLDPYVEYISKFSQAVKDTHIKNKLGEVDVFIPQQEINQKNKLITSGLQGDEPAGPMALLKWVQSNKAPSNIFFIPILSAESYVNKTHFDNSGQNVNLQIPHNPSYEIEELINPTLLQKMSSGGFLSCQEDPNRDVSYLMVWKHNEGLIQDFLEILEDNFKIRGDGVRTTDVIEDNTTIGNYCAKLGAPVSITTETPIINTSITKRIDAQVSMITKFVEYDGKV